MQLALAVLKLQRIVGAVARDAFQRPPVLQLDHGVQIPGNRIIARIEDGFAQLRQRMRPPGVGQIRTQRATLPADAVTTAASRLAPKDLLAGGHIPRRVTLRSGRGQRSQKRDQLPGLRLRQIRPGHAPARHAFLNHHEQRVVFELVGAQARPQVRTAPALPFRAMAGRARVGKLLAPGLYGSQVADLRTLGFGGIVQFAMLRE